MEHGDHGFVAFYSLKDSAFRKMRNKIRAKITLRKHTQILLLKTFAIIVLVAIAFVSGLTADFAREYFDAEKQIESIESSFRHDDNFTLFGDYRIWRAKDHPDRCFSVAKRVKR